MKLCTRSGSTTTLKSDGRRTVEDLESPRAADGSVASGGDLSASSVAYEADVCRAAVLGAPKVGKTTLTRQLLTSEYLANKDNYHGKYNSRVHIDLDTQTHVRLDVQVLVVDAK